MLARAADNLYWMARGMERAEHLARMLEVSVRMAMLPASKKASARMGDWSDPLVATGTLEDFTSRYEAVTEGRVLSYLILDRRNSVSIRSCLWQARENARATRHLLTQELWEAINRTWLEASDLTWTAMRRHGVSEHLEWVRFRSHLVRGTLMGSQRRSDGFYLFCFGIAVERADNTARLLRTKWDRLSGAIGGPGVTDYYRAGVLLESLSAHKCYREIYSTRLEPRRIAEMLIQRADVPRSLAFCLSEMADRLRALDPASPILADIGSLERRVADVQIDDLLRVGLHYFLDDVIGQVAVLSDRVRSHYLMVQ
jgi:uncharacterized alpha-E superfamily protein